MPTVMWHKAWADNVKKVTELCSNKWIKYLTLWWLSTENLVNREEEELKWIIKIINNAENLLWEALMKWVKINLIWDISKLPEKSQNILSDLKEKTKTNTWIVLTLALVYWWKDEIIRWFKKFIKEWWDINNLTKENFRNCLDSWDLPLPDVIVRTGWDIRHSWFLLYDSDYSEYYFTPKKWPEFDEEELDKVIEFFNKSKRNFWK